MPRILTIKNVVKEMVWLAPELLEDEEYMNEWCQKYFGVKFNKELKATNE